MKASLAQALRAVADRVSPRPQTEIHISASQVSSEDVARALREWRTREELRCRW